MTKLLQKVSHEASRMFNYGVHVYKSLTFDVQHLYEACYNGDATKVGQLLPFAIYGEIMKAFELSCMCDQVAVAHTILDSEYGPSKAFMLACLHGHLSLVKRLVDIDDIEARDLYWGLRHVVVGAKPERTRQFERHRNQIICKFGRFYHCQSRHSRMPRNHHECFIFLVNRIKQTLISPPCLETIQDCFKNACCAGNYNGLVDLMSVYSPSVDILNESLKYACHCWGTLFVHIATILESHWITCPEEYVEIILLLIRSGSTKFDCIARKPTNVMTLVDHGLELRYVSRISNPIYNQIRMYIQNCNAILYTCVPIRDIRSIIIRYLYVE